MKTHQSAAQSSSKTSHLNSIRTFFSKPFFSDYRTIAVLWVILAIVAAITKGGLSGDKLNNFQIFRYVYYHLIDLKSLYALYPAEYGDCNHYGPAFSLIIAPFSLMPQFLGLLSWLLFMGGLLYVAILKLPSPIGHAGKIFIFWFVSNEVLSSMQMAQFNLAVAALMIASYTAIKRGHTGWAACFIMISSFTKIYGILGLVFILFTDKKWRFIGWNIIWAIILFALPMVISSPEYVLSQYMEWARSLIEKNELNVAVGFNTQSNYYQNISILGMIHRITQLEFSDLYILVPGALLYLLPMVRTSQYRYAGFQYGVVASSLMCIILFSTGSESSGYIIAMLGVALWYISAPGKRSSIDLALLIFALIIGSFGTSDLMPSFLKRGYIRPYSLKALPVTLVWLKLLYEMCTVNYAIYTSKHRGNADCTSTVSATAQTEKNNC